MFDVVLLMAGSGSRTKLGYNKVFYKINEKPIYQYSLETFQKIEDCDKIVLVVKEEEIPLVSHLKSERIIITIGGLLRQDSVRNGVEKTTQPIVLIHDAARCNVKKEDIINVYQETIANQSAVLAVKVTDTIKESENTFIKKTLNRNMLWAMQTPQGVMRIPFIKCLKAAQLDNYKSFDDVEILEKYGGIKAKIVEGRFSNIKVTTEVDLTIIEVLMREGL